MQFREDKLEQSTALKVYKAFGTLRAVQIPAGNSEVRMEYRSAPFHKTILVSVIAAVLLIALGAVAAVRYRKM